MTKDPQKEREIAAKARVLRAENHQGRVLVREEDESVAGLEAVSAL